MWLPSRLGLHHYVTLECQASSGATLDGTHLTDDSTEKFMSMIPGYWEDA